MGLLPSEAIIAVPIGVISIVVFFIGYGIYLFREEIREKLRLKKSCNQTDKKEF
jgi:hypothetical protein